jgi:predicted enzyme related to lactoylglutathione lyase
MPRIESYEPGSFVWAELATSDAAAAKAFYCDLFGWTFNDSPMPNGTYTIFQSEGNDSAALYENNQMPPAWAIYFSTPDVDASAATVKELGGSIVMGPMDIGPPGIMAVAQDPRGMVFNLWQAKANIGLKHGGFLNRVMWPELYSSDPAASHAFYTGLLGWTSKPQTGFENAPYVEWVNHGQSIGGMVPMLGDAWKGVPEHWIVYVTVADCDERATRAVALGAKLRVPPHDIPNVGRFAVVVDPQGAAFAIIKMTATHQPATA